MHAAGLIVALTLSGSVVCNDSPLPGATVTLATPRGSFTAVTDATGHFAFQAIAPGWYCVESELNGLERAAIDVEAPRDGSGIVLRMKPPISDALTVSAFGPHALQPINITKELIDSLPVRGGFHPSPKP